LPQKKEAGMKRRGFVAGAAFLAAPAIVQAQAVENWPGTRPVRIIHPSQAGGPGDIYTRLLCEHFSRVFGGTFVTENRVGGTGTIGTAAVAQAAPDGWTLLMSSNTAHIVSPLVLPSVPYDPVRAFTAVAAIYRYGMMLIVSPKLPVKNTAEFVAWATGTPRAIVERLNAETNRWIESPAIRQRMAEGAHEPMVGTPEAMDAYWAEERRLWTALVNETRATLN
jgi:tripartite-type tricarboxylate transporter receptor subunit TctC